MKHRFFVILLLIPIFSLSQTRFPIDGNGKITYEEVVVIDSAKAKDLYAKGLSWFVENFKSPKDVIQMQVPETNTILASGTTTTQWPPFVGKKNETYPLAFNINISTKEGRYKYIITDLKILAGSGDLLTLVQKKDNKPSETARRFVDESVQRIINSLKLFMSEKDSW